MNFHHDSGFIIVFSCIDFLYTEKYWETKREILRCGGNKYWNYGLLECDAVYLCR
jgi:hypothetical protein